MASGLRERFYHDLGYLKENQIPKRDGGREIDELDYSGKDEEKLTDDDVKELAQALMNND